MAYDGFYLTYKSDRETNERFDRVKAKYPNFRMVVPASETLADDESYEYAAPDGASFTVICDPKSLLYIYGMQLDFSTALIGGGFNFTNPNATQTCGCGSSFAV